MTGRVIELLVENHPGTMSHVVGLFTRRAYNLEGILCGPLDGPADRGPQSRVILLVREDARLSHLLREIARLYDVTSVSLRDDCDPGVFRRIDEIARRAAPRRSTMAAPLEESIEEDSMSAIRSAQSHEYRKRRDELLEAEAALVAQRERVAELRRGLGAGTPLATEYVFREGPGDLSRNDESDFFDTRLSELFGDKSELIIDHMMFAPESDTGCPMCSMWADGIDAVAHHVSDRVALALVARAPLAKLRDWGRRRGWRRLRLLSSYANDFNPDFGTELSPDRQLPAMSVFTRDAAGQVRHVYTSEGSLVERHHRAVDLMTPVWNLFDLTPSGRGDWFPKHFYDE